MRLDGVAAVSLRGVCYPHILFIVENLDLKRLSLLLGSASVNGGTHFLVRRPRLMRPGGFGPLVDLSTEGVVNLFGSRWKIL